MSVRDDIIRGAELCARQGSSPNHYLMNTRDFAELEEWQWRYEVTSDIARLPTHHERSTRLSQMVAAQRLARRKGLRFDPRAWWADKRPR